MKFLCPLLSTTLLTCVTTNISAQQAPQPDSLRVLNLASVTIGAQLPLQGIGGRKISRGELDVIQAPTLGEALSRIPGVQQSYFGPNANTPVIRSMSGHRVKTLSNGLSLNDLSGISPGLNLLVDMDNLLGLEVYKTGASILYGGNAIGGAINLRDNSIPYTRFPKKVTGFATGSGSTNNGFRQAFDLNGNLGKKWAWHIGTMHRRNRQVRIPGNTKAPIAYNPRIDDLTQTMAQVIVDKEITRNLSLYPYLSRFVLENMNNPAWGLGEADLYTFEETSFIDGLMVKNPRNDKYIPGQPPNTPLSTTTVKGIYDYVPVKKGMMPNSHAGAHAVNAGMSFITDRFYAGIGYQSAFNCYGIPGFTLRKLPGHTHRHADGTIHEIDEDKIYLPINIQSEYHNFRFESTLRSFVPGISSVKLHYLLQLSDDREQAGKFELNRFKTRRHAARLEIEQQPYKFLKGLSGIDLSATGMKGAGKQRYLPDNRALEYAAFTLQQIAIKPVQIDLGYRYGIARRHAALGNGYTPGRGLAGGRLLPRNFYLHQFSGSLKWELFKAGYLKTAYVHAERAPGVNELYAGNNHYAIMIEENGEDRLKKETVRTWEFGGGIEYSILSMEIICYQSAFKDYMYMAHTGVSRSGGFLVKEWRQSDTRINGWEAEVACRSLAGKNLLWDLSAYVDLVKNINTSQDEMRQWAEGDFMPNMPTSRLGAATKLGYRKMTWHVMFDHYLKQRYLGKNINPEPPMPSYSLLSARITFKNIIKGIGMEYYLGGSNILNAEARPQQSFLKYLAPLPGRNIELGLKARI